MGLNLIDQSDILKGLDDQTLQREMQQPSGTVPPFLVLSEISRRKDMRQRYAGEVASKMPKTTVAQDVLSAPAMPGMAPMGAPPAPGGIAAAAQMGGGAPSPMPPPAGGPGFASGGLVSAADPSVLDYNTLAQQYQSDLNTIPQQREQAQALALLAAGAGILGGGHSNLGQNLGAGISAGINSYTGALNTETARQTNDLRGLADLASSQHANDLGQLEYQLRLRQQGQAEDPNSVQNTPTLVRTADAIAAMPEGPAKEMAQRASMMQSQYLDPATLDQIATQYLAGDKSAAVGFGRSPTARAQIANAIAAKAASMGIDGTDIAAQMAAYQGNLAGQRTAGVKGANVSIAADEANQMADIALEASKGVPRGSFVPWNKAMNMVATNTSSPELAKFVTATTSLVNAYARAVSPVGVSTDAARQHAYDMLNVAQGPDAYAAVIAQMKKEMSAALSAPKDVSERLKENITGGGTTDATPAPVGIGGDAETNALVDKWLK